MEQERSINSILIFIVGFIVGVFVASLVFVQPLVSLLFIILGVVILVAEKLHKGELEKQVFILALLIISFGIGAIRYEVKDFHDPVPPTNTGVVVTEPELRENSTRFAVLTDNGEKVLVSTDLYSSVEYGDRVSIDGNLQEPGVIEPSTSSGQATGRAFDYGAYLAKDDIYYVTYSAEVEVLDSGQGNPIKHTLFSIKNSVVGKIREILPEPESSLLAGLIVAGKQAMPKDILEEFRRAGIIHIVVLSGYNVTIIAVFLRKIFESLYIWGKVSTKVPKFSNGPVVAGTASILGILLFVLMTGGEPTVVRASLMVLVVIAAQMFGRTYSPSRALFGAGFLMVLHNPKILVFDPSFQLSFIATCALIYIVPIFEKWLHKISNKWELRTMLATTIATQVAVLPLLIYSMGDVSLVSLPANVLVLLFIPLTMLVGFSAALISYVSTIIAWPFAYISHLFLAWILGVSHYLGNLKFASISVPVFPFWITLVAYVVLITFVWRWRSLPPQNPSSG